MSIVQWTNIGEDEGALHALLERVAAHAHVTSIDHLWIFPPRRIAIGESSVIVAALFDEDRARRRVLTAHFTVARDRKGRATVNAAFAEHGSAPPDALPRIVLGVLRRLGEDTDAPPREEQIAGSTDAWLALISDLGGSPPPAPATEPDAADDPAAADG